MRSSLFSLLLLPLASAFNTYRSPVTDCLNDAEVPILLASSDGWSEAIIAFNLRFTPVPNIVAMPRTEQHVQSAVKCADGAGIKVSVRGGGHSYGAYALSGAMVIDMVEFQEVTLDPDTKIVSVGAGLRLGNLANTLFDLDERALPHGTCASVGVGGHASLGGFGLDSRLFGLMVDTIVGFEVVLADGTCQTVTADCNPDLFWALRGAGAGFCIITTFHFQTVAAPPNNIFWSYTYVFDSPSASTDAFQFASDWALQHAPKELGYGIVLSPGTFVIRGVFYGVRADYDALIAPLLAAMQQLHNDVAPAATVEELGWIDSLILLAGGPIVLPPQGDGAHDTFYVKSIETHESAPLSRGAILSFFVYLANAPLPTASDWFIIINLYGGPESVITSFPASTDPASTSSYAGRDTGYVWQIYGNMVDLKPPFDDDVIGYLGGMVDALGAEAAELPGYAPYPDTTFSKDEAQTRYWGDGAPRLRAIKAIVDPKGTVYNPQGF